VVGDHSSIWLQTMSSNIPSICSFKLPRFQNYTQYWFRFFNRKNIIKSQY